MIFQIDTVTRDFSPAETAQITGVALDLQRDWRRRGFLPARPDTKRARFTLDDIILMTVARRFSASGFNVSDAMDIAALSVLPVIGLLSEWEDTAVFEGDEISEDAQDRVRFGAVRNSSPSDRFVVATFTEDGRPTASRAQDLAKAQDVMSDADAMHCVIVDNHAVAHRIAMHSPLPIIRFKATIKGEA